LRVAAKALVRFTQEEREPGVPAADEEQVQRRLTSAVYHAATVWRRLTATHRDFWENVAIQLSRIFTQFFGGAYTAELVRVVQQEPDDPPPPAEEEEEDDSQYVQTLNIVDRVPLLAWSWQVVHSFA